METLFALLGGMLAAIGVLFGTDYQHISIYVCIWLWPAICLASSLPFLIVSIKRALGHDYKLCGILGIVFSIFYLLVGGGITRFFVNDYTISNCYDSFNRCVEDLVRLGEMFSMTYAEINIVIYIGLFLLIEIFWIIMYYLMKPKKRV